MISGDRILGHNTAKHPTTITKTNIVFRGPKTSSFAIFLVLFVSFSSLHSRSHSTGTSSCVIKINFQDFHFHPTIPRSRKLVWQLSKSSAHFLSGAINFSDPYGSVRDPKSAIFKSMGFFERRTPVDWAGSMWHSRISSSFSYADILPSQPPACCSNICGIILWWRACGARGSVQYGSARRRRRLITRPHCGDSTRSDEY